MRRLAVILLFSFALFADEATTAARLESLQQDPLLLRRFLEQMPKGGDLHNHLSGTAYAETFLTLAASDGLCIDTQRLALAQCDAESKTQVPASQALKESSLYTKMLDSMSMRQFREIDESGHDHFFATFNKFSAVARNHVPEMLTEVVSRFSRENVDYVESLFSQDLGAARELGKSVKPGASFEEMRTALLANGVPEVVKRSRATIDDAEAKMRDTLGCATPSPKSGCASTVRYLFETHRAFARESLFAELLVGFELASADSRVVGVNTVQPEDSYQSMASFDELMRMFAYLRPLYPNVRVSAHAGELAPGLVTPEGLQNHVRDTVMIAKAERIGHGVDIAYETDALALLREMSSKAIAVEVCLTSNDVILGVTGKRHPLRLYLRSNVPVVLATDDPGVSRRDMTNEWQRAVEEHGLTYRELKRIARNSIEYSFLEGASLWADRDYRKRNPACAREQSDTCKAFLVTSAKAREQLRLELRLREFENTELR
ncbi:MAG TPA: adenosine deaminase [Thermoanaerobaculia bacterium]|nr:adenosine deaminase [Thermoanaerobaculia bacterium]